jgi:hypothetical protein
MKLTMTIIASVLVAGLASAQNPSIVQNTRNTMNGVSNNATAASNQALGVTAAPVQSADATVKRRPRHARAVPGTHGAIMAMPKPNAPASAAAPANGTAGDAATEQASAGDVKYDANGKRDPFISPVVSHAGGSGCSTGKKCLEIGAINLRGVVRSDAGFIAVVSNDVNKAYFLRENDPVFNGYVVKITGDSIVFQETLQDRLGKTFTREVVKKITTPAV